jgi:hypothetical protein
LYAAFHDGQVHDPLGGGSYAFEDDLIQPLLFGLVNDEALSEDNGSDRQATPSGSNMPSRPIIIHAGAQPNNSPHCGTLIVFSYAFAVARAIRDRMRAMAAASNSEFHPPPVSVEVTLIDTAPVDSEGLEIGGIHYQKSHRDMPDTLAAWIGDYHEVLGILSDWSGIPFTTIFQSDFFSHPSMPQLLQYLVTNRHTLGRQLSPKHGTLALRAACPVTGCALAEKHGRLNRYNTTTATTVTTTTTTTTTTTITFHCPHHGPHTLPLSSPSTTARLEANAPTRNLLRSMTHLLDTQAHHIRVTGADYAGTYQEALLYRPLAEWSASTVASVRGRTPHILYAPLVVDWSGAKLSKSLYVRAGGYPGMRVLGMEGLLSYRVLRGAVGEVGLRRVWEEVGRWVADPRRVFRCFSVEYLRRVVVEGMGWEGGGDGESG